METFLLSIITVLSCSFAADYTCGDNIAEAVKSFQSQEQETPKQPTEIPTQQESEKQDEHSGTN